MLTHVSDGRSLISMANNTAQRFTLPTDDTDGYTWCPRLGCTADEHSQLCVDRQEEQRLADEAFFEEFVS